MEIIKEKGVIYVTSRTKSMGVDTKGLWIPVGIRKFYYDHVVWIDSLKFAFGCWDDPDGKLEAMVEFTTGGVAACKEGIPRPTIEKLIEEYKHQLVKHSAKCGEEVVNHFNLKHTIQAWQIKLWAL